MASTVQSHLLGTNLLSTLQIMNSRKRVPREVVEALLAIVSTRASGAAFVVDERRNAMAGEMVGVERLGFTIGVPRALQQEEGGTPAPHERQSQRPDERDVPTLEAYFLFLVRQRRRGYALHVESIGMGSGRGRHHARDGISLKLALEEQAHGQSEFHAAGGNTDVQRPVIDRRGW